MSHTAAARMIALIPALDPGAILLRLVGDLQARGIGQVVVVDDGSAPAAQDILQGLRQRRGVVVLQHAANRGKGAALKTALRFVADRKQDTAILVTMDADGQHSVDDALSVAALAMKRPGVLVLGSRRFDSDVPFRSRLGNAVTRRLLRLLTGLRLTDTQSGLRAIPASLIPLLLETRANYYEFELQMLLLARSRAIPIVETPIETIYIADNIASHFRVVRDSTRIAWALVRSCLR